MIGQRVHYDQENNALVGFQIKLKFLLQFWPQVHPIAFKCIDGFYPKTVKIYHRDTFSITHCSLHGLVNDQLALTIYWQNFFVCRVALRCHG